MANFNEIRGTFVFGTTTFDAGYRYNATEDWCTTYLRIYAGKDANGKYVNGHDFFGDDKFSIKNIKLSFNKIDIKLHDGLQKGWGKATKFVRRITLKIGNRV